MPRILAFEKQETQDESIIDSIDEHIMPNDATHELLLEDATLYGTSYLSVEEDKI